MSQKPKPFRIAFIGSGAIAQRHMKWLKTLPAVQVVAAAEINDWWVEKTKTDYGLTAIYKDYKAMLAEHADVDAVSVCTPNSLHAEHSIYALERGKHVLVEKPMAINVAQARQMLDAARRAGKHLVIGFQYRFDPKTKVLREQIAAGAFGKILYVRAVWLRRRGIPSWGPFGRKDLQGGGPLIDVGVHVIETAHYLMGSPRPVSATGGAFTYIGNQPPAALAEWGPWDHKTYTVEDLAVGMIRFDTGALMTVETSFAAHIEQDQMEITILGEKGGANWTTSKVFKDENGYQVTTQPALIGTWDPFEYKMRHFVEVCRDGRPNEATAEHAFEIQEMLDALYASAEKGREVRIE